MNGKFITADQTERDQLDWGQLGWMSRPSTTGAEHLVVIEVTLEPGFGHDFHRHPDQEEVIYVIEGSIEQWVDTEKKILNLGDSAFIPGDMVHASFNTSAETVKLLAILGPCKGEEGYQLVEVHEEAPWNSLRNG